MRYLLFFVSTYFISCTSYAVGPESCRLTGKINGKTIALEYIDEGAYGSSKTPEYGYCVMGAMENESWFMNCSTKKGEEPIIRYETGRGDNIPASKRGEYARVTSTYICKSGCAATVVKQFRLECDG